MAVIINTIKVGFIKAFFFLAIITIFVAGKATAQAPVKMENIAKHIGDSVKICTKIYGGRFLPRMKDAPTYLDAGADYPNNPLIIFIAKKDRQNFEEQPEMMFAYKEVCITGKLEMDKEKGKPRITVTTPEQIKLQQQY